MVRVVDGGSVVGSVVGLIGFFWQVGVSMSLMSSISQVYGFLDLRSQQEEQLHESLVNRLTYGCKPVKRYTV